MEVIFIRADCFYVLELPDDDDIEAHVRCNPGTLRVERADALSAQSAEHERKMAALRAERDELREALRELLSIVDGMAKHPRDGGGVFPADYGIAKAKARAVLAKAAP